MCGIAGQVARRRPADSETVERITRGLHHRGPDDVGHWTSTDGSVMLGHRRLAILDLSARGRQPMLSPDRRYVIVYNGEIYNFRELRNGLAAKGWIFQTQTDTEVLLGLWARHGEKCLSQIRGMYAFAIWDTQERTLWLVRDPLGIKPLYYRANVDGLTFASETRPLRYEPLTIDPAGVGCFLRMGSIPAPFTTHCEIRALRPATVLQWTQEDGVVHSKRYWHLDDAWKQSRSKLAGIRRYDDTCELVRSVLLDSVRLHLVSDVPIAAFLSGGIDSFAVVSLMRDAGQNRIETFTIGSHDEATDESAAAARSAQSLQTSHHSFLVGRNQFARSMASFLEAMDQPTVDGFNTYLVSNLAADAGFKVVTSGVGGDELFRGYRATFVYVPRVSRAYGAVPAVARRAMAELGRRLEARVGGRWRRVAGALRTDPSLGNIYLWTRELFSPDEVARLFDDRHFGAVASTMPPVDLTEDILPDYASAGSALSVWEVRRYLMPQLLRDSDNFSMAHSLELRVPLVDAWVYNELLAIGDLPGVRSLGTSKKLLVDAARLPAALQQAKKRGFSLPFRDWISHFPLPDRSSGISQSVAEEIYSDVRAGRQHWSRAWAISVLNSALK